MGGKKTARTARKMSELHMAFEGRVVGLRSMYHLQACDDGAQVKIQDLDKNLIRPQKESEVQQTSFT